MALKFSLGMRRACNRLLLFMERNGTQMRYMSVQEREESEMQESKYELPPETDTSPYQNPMCVNEVRLLGNVGRQPSVVLSMENRKYVYFPIWIHFHIEKNLGENFRFSMMHKVFIRDKSLQKFTLEQVTNGTRVFVIGSLRNKKFIFDGATATPELVTFVHCEKLLLLWKPNKSKVEGTSSASAE